MFDPKTLYLSLQVPASLWISSDEWNLQQKCRIAGSFVEGNDTPWCGLADLLIDYRTREFIGLTFQISDKWDWEGAKELAGRLDSSVVHYSDLSIQDDIRCYADGGEESHWIEVSWIKSSQKKREAAQLLCGQWFWWYDIQGNWGICKPVVALGISHLEEILNEHRLVWPEEIELPRLDVEWV